MVSRVVITVTGASWSEYISIRNIIIFYYSKLGMARWEIGMDADGHSQSVLHKIPTLIYILLIS